ncbi:MAG: lactate utilization protein [Synergistaceae bacterium]|jgi:L-lactate utilization protein LutB|nr:lactate utilization protein [Synergistaceae bacterium]
MSQSPQEARNEKLGLTVMSALQHRGFEAFYAAGREEAVNKAVSLVPEGSCVSWGGSVTLQDLKLPDRFHNGNYNVLDRDRATSPEERMDIMRRALACDFFITGVNALSEDGQMVNIDAGGNRVASIVFGPKNVIVVAGINKVVKTLDDAITRARTVAAPINLQRFPQAKVPCRQTGTCGNCSTPDSFCSQILITRICRPAGRIKVVLTGETLGY